MSSREIRIDALRGLALVLIYWVHGLLLTEVNYLPLQATPMVLAFCDVSELFIFLAGVVFGRIYDPIIRQSLATAQLRATGRAFELWVANTALTGVILALTLRLGVYLYPQPTEMLMAVPLLRFQAYCLDVLPLYIALLLIAPLALALYQRHPKLAVGLSALLWGGVQVHPQWNFSATISGTDNGLWTFNPFAWQALFLAGVWPSVSRPSHWLSSRAAPTLDVLATLLVFGGTLAKTLWLVLEHGPPPDAPTDWSEAIRIGSRAFLPSGVAAWTMPNGTLAETVYTPGW